MDVGMGGGAWLSGGFVRLKMKNPDPDYKALVVSPIR